MNLLPKKGWKVRTLFGIFLEIEVRCKCDYNWRPNMKSYNCENKFCTCFYSIEKKWICWNCFIVEYRQWIFNHSFGLITKYLKIRHDTISSMFQKHVCKDITNEILAYSERNPDDLICYSEK
jgi:hypothetical protein